MKRRTFIRAASTVGVGGLGGLSGCTAPTANQTTEPAGDGGTGANETTTGTTAADGTETDQEGQDGGPQRVRMVTEGDQYYFDPIGLFVEPGDTVEWVNESGAHSSTAYAEGNGGAEVTRIPSDAESWNSEILTEEGATFSYTFEVTGTYDYFCIPHKTLGMVARIVCGEPGDVEGDPPDGPVPAEQAIVEQGAISFEEFEPETTTDGGGG